MNFILISLYLLLLITSLSMAVDSSSKFKFSNYFFSFKMSDNEPANTQIGLIPFSNSSALLNLNDQLEFSLVSSTDNLISAKSSLFQIEILKNGIAIKTRPNSVRQNNSAAFNFILYAFHRTNNAKPIARSFVTVSCLSSKSTPLPKSPPKFKKPVYEAQLFENNAPDTLVVHVEATLANLGHLTYHLITAAASTAEFAKGSGGGDIETAAAASFSSLFQIKSDTGEIFVKRTLNREHRDSYSLTVLAMGSGSSSSSSSSERLSSTVQVVVRVMQQNEQIKPQLNALVYNISLAETVDFIKKPVVFRASEKLRSISEPFVFSLTGSMSELNTFEIESETGLVYLVSKLNFEIKQLYRLGLVVRDLSVPSSATYATLNVFVENTIQVAPTFPASFFEFILFENASIGQRVGHVSAAYTTQRVHGSKSKKIFYSLETTGGGLPFRIEPQNGTIYTTQQISKQARSNYEFYVSADQTASVKVKVRVLDLNDNVPEFSKKSISLNISEEVAIGLPLVTLFVVNRDSSSFLEYSIENDGNSNDDTSLGIFSLVRQTPTRVYLTLDRANLNYKKRSAHVVNVKVIDQDGLYSYANVRINVLPNFKFSPRFTKDIYTFELYENAKLGTFVGRVEALALQDSQITYQLFVANAENGLVADDAAVQYAEIRNKNNDFRLDEQTGKQIKKKSYFFLENSFENIKNNMKYNLVILYKKCLII